MENSTLESNVVFHDVMEYFVPDCLHCILEFTSLNSPWVSITARPMGKRRDVNITPNAIGPTARRKMFVGEFDGTCLWAIRKLYIPLF